MNSLLEKLYNTGTAKTASADEVLDLSKISAEEFVKGIESGEIVENATEPEKVANDQVDLTKLSDEQLLALAKNLQEREKTANENDPAAYFQEAGRIMARSFAEEMSKGAEAEELIPLSEVSAEQLMGLDPNEWEIVEMEKEAAEASLLSRAWKATGGKIGKHYAGRLESAQERAFANSAKNYVNKGGEPGKVSKALAKAKGYAREFAPEAAGAAALTGGSVAAKHFLSKKGKK